MSDIMVKEWSDISANTIKALTIMGKGMLAIFVVIVAIMLVVLLFNLIDKKLATKKLAKEQESSVPTTNDEVVQITSNNAIPMTSSVSEVQATAYSSEDEEIRRSEIGNSKYRKTGKSKIKDNYRK